MSDNFNNQVTKVPYRQIRALYDQNTITCYQAYSEAIAIPAVREQRLYASRDFFFGRMTWIKPSWAWMMYRSGYGTKDAKQARILALKMTHDNFRHLLSLAQVTASGIALTAEQKAKPVRVQWDPERSPSLEPLPYRSIQIGISRDISRKWAEEWIESIEDVTERAKGLKDALDSEGRLEIQDLVARSLFPEEREFELPESLKKSLGML